MGWEDRAYNRDDNGGIPPVVFRMPPFTRLTGGIILVCFIVFLAQAFGPGSITYGGLLSYEDGLAWRQPWRFITYQYLHVSAWHFGINMLILYFFLPTLELRWGWAKALGFYTLGGVVGGLTFGLLSIAAPHGMLMGASGSIMAAMGAVALFYPERQFIFGIPIRVGVAILGFLYLLSAMADRNLSDAAHIGGLVFGFVAPLVAGPMLARQQHEWRRRKVLRHSQMEIREQEQIDQILAKVSQHGMHSLTNAEKKALKRATERQRRSEMASNRRY
jgi:membrane associated rhomboid family serine protease